MKKLLTLLPLAIAFVVVLATPAFAHATLNSATPTPEADSVQPPKSVTLYFSEPVTFANDAIRVFDSKGNELKIGKTVHGARSSIATASLPKLNDGIYAVTWRVISADTHPVQGAFSFAVGNAVIKTGSSDFARQQLAKEGTHNNTVGIAYGIVRFFAFIALALLIGVTAFVTTLWHAGWDVKRVRRVIFGAWIVALVGTVLMIPLQTAYASGHGLTKGFVGSGLSETLGARAGHAWIARIVLLIVALPILLALRRRPSAQSAAAMAGVVVGTATLLTVSLAGHASTGRWLGFAVPMDTLHLIAVSLWFGGLCALTLEAIQETDIDALEPIADGFSRLAMAAVVVIIGTGVFQSLRQVQHIDDLLHTGYGRLLLIKIGIFAGVLVIASSSRSIVRYEIRGEARRAMPEPLPVGPGAMRASSEDDFEPPEPEDTLHRFRTAVVFEIIFAIAIFAVTAALVNAAPISATTNVNKPYLETLKSGDGKLWFEVEVAPTKVGATQVHITAERESGIVQPTLQMTVTLANPQKNVAPINVRLIRIGPGHYASTGAAIPFPGQWQLTAKALVTDVNEEVATGSFKVS